MDKYRSFAAALCFLIVALPRASLSMPRFSLQASAVQQEQFVQRLTLGLAPWPSQNLEVIVGFGHEDSSGLEQLFGLRNHIMIVDGLSFAATGQLLALDHSRFLEAIFGLGLGEKTGLALDLGVGIRWCWQEDSKRAKYDSWRLFPTLGLGYLF